jgi:hypothetical protein
MTYAPGHAPVDAARLRMPSKLCLVVAVHEMVGCHCRPSDNETGVVRLLFVAYFTQGQIDHKESVSPLDKNKLEAKRIMRLAPAHRQSRSPPQNYTYARA